MKGQWEYPGSHTCRTNTHKGQVCKLATFHTSLHFTLFQKSLNSDKVGMAWDTEAPHGSNEVKSAEVKRTFLEHVSFYSGDTCPFFPALLHNPETASDRTNPYPVSGLRESGWALPVDSVIRRSKQWLYRDVGPSYPPSCLLSCGSGATFPWSQRLCEGFSASCFQSTLQLLFIPINLQDTIIT